MGMFSESIGQFLRPGGFMPPTATRAHQFLSHSPDQSAGHPMFQPFNTENFLVLCHVLQLLCACRDCSLKTEKINSKINLLTITLMVKIKERLIIST